MKKLLVGALFCLWGCGGGDSTAPVLSLSGTYVLQTVGGSNLPARIYQAPDGTVDVTAGSVSFGGGMSWNGSITYRAFVVGSGTADITEPGGGTYTLNGSAIVLTDNIAQESHTGTVSGNTISTVLETGLGQFAMVFRK